MSSQDVFRINNVFDLKVYPILGGITLADIEEDDMLMAEDMEVRVLQIKRYDGTLRSVVAGVICGQKVDQSAGKFMVGMMLTRQLD